ncbi:acyl-CoA thioesterase [Cognatishimia sp.]|uniref:acyl-CoA thioesterase n=1 Tax=Cognatishimia sp. TaxID=2211648 RepID=UPI00351565EB|nr:acyl-CoA thioesterase [Cognatishimia sp.]
MDATYRIRLPFRDIDMHGHMHNAAYVSHFEAALSHALRAHGLGQAFAPGGSYMFLVRKIEVTFAAPCYYDEEISVRTQVARIGGSSLTFTLKMSVETKLKASAEIIWICVDKATGRSQEIPDELCLDLEQMT